MRLCHRPEFYGFYGFFMVRFASLLRERGTFQKKRSSRPRGVKKKLRLQHLSNGSRFFWQYVLPVRAPDLFSPYMQNGCGSAMFFEVSCASRYTEYVERLRFSSVF